MPFTKQQKTYLARHCRKQVIRGRNGVGYFSTEGYACAPDEPQMADRAKRGQHYGYVSEPPDGTECITLAINGGASNRVSVAEYTTDEPTIDKEEVLLWSRAGQRVLLNKDGDVQVNGGTAKVARVGDTVSVKIYYTTATVAGVLCVTGISGTGGPEVETLTGTIQDNGSVKFKA